MTGFSESPDSAWTVGLCVDRNRASGGVIARMAFHIENDDVAVHGQPVGTGGSCNTGSDDKKIAFTHGGVTPEFSTWLLKHRCVGRATVGCGCGDACLWSWKVIRLTIDDQPRDGAKQLRIRDVGSKI